MPQAEMTVVEAYKQASAIMKKMLDCDISVTRASMKLLEINAASGLRLLCDEHSLQAMRDKQQGLTVLKAMAPDEADDYESSEYEDSGN